MSSEELAKKIKLRAWNMGYEAKASHMSGNFSMADIIAVLYHDCINISVDNSMLIAGSRGHIINNPIYFFVSPVFAGC